MEIDGSYGEGGGQLLRYSVALAALLGKKVRVYNIRAKRSNPGLRAQHLTAVRTIATLVNAKVEGLRIGSTELTVEPRGRPKGGEYSVDIGTAGSVSLLLQAVLPVLAAAEEGVKLRVRGGTDVKWSPPIEYFQNVLLPLLKRFGLRAESRLLRRGFYPEGGGLVEVSVEPSYPLKPLVLDEPGELKEVRGISYAANLPKHVAERQASAAAKALRSAGYERYLSRIEISMKTPSIGTGSGIVIWAAYERGVVGGDALGERGKRAEVVGREAAEKLINVLNSRVPVDSHALDNVIIYMALADGESEVVSNELTSHASTAVWLVSQLSRAPFKTRGEVGRARVRAKGIGFKP